jgi:putative membrane protein
MRLNPTGALFFLAHAGHLHASAVIRWWSWEPLVVITLAITGALYAIGFARLGAGRKSMRWQALAFAGGYLALLIALVSPIDTLGGILFSAHMVQHELLMLVAAPLLVLGRPLTVMLWALPRSWRAPASAWTRTAPVTAAWRAITAPIAATVLHGLTLWTWHLPSLYQATLRNDAIHALQHTSFLLTATLFWWSLINGRYGRIGYGVAVVYIFITSAHSGALGALLTFAPSLVYPIYGPVTRQWGLDPLEDQQLAGLIMWVPAGIILVVVGLALFAAWMAEAERRVRFTQSENLK